MNTHVLNSKTDNPKSGAGGLSHTGGGGDAFLEFVDNRPEAITQRKFSKLANSGQHLSWLTNMDEITNGNSAQVIPHHSQQTPVQRFPANVYTNAHNWSGGGYTITPLGGGVMASLFTLTQNPPLLPGEVGTVIVKTLEVNEPESVSLGEEFLRRMGMATPADRVIMPGTAEFISLATALGLPQDVNHNFLSNNKVVGGLLVMQDLMAAGATTIQSKMMQAATQADIDDVFTWMTDPVVLDAIGKLIVYDSAIGNFDRITLDRQNFGNLMISRGGAVATQVFLIDTNARLPHLNMQILEKANKNGAFYDSIMNSNLLKGIFANRNWAIGNWFEAIPQMINDQQQLREDKGQGRVAFLDTQSDYITQKVAQSLAASTPLITASLDQAFIDLRTMISNKADPRRQAIKAASTGTQSFDTLKANVAYLEQRTRPSPGAGQPGPLGHDTAANIVETYGRYKVAKATFNLPVNQALAPLTHMALAIPPRLQASKIKEIGKGDKFKTKQMTDFTNFNPLYTAFKTDLKSHNDYLKELKPFLKNLVKLRQSLAGPGETRNQRALVSLNKRTAEAQRLRILLQNPTNTALLWAGQYVQKARALIPELARVSDRYNTLQSSGEQLGTAADTLHTNAEEVRNRFNHI